MDNLERFIKAQEYEYDLALKEIKNGRKRNHWMWYIFPQIKGLGQSDTAIYYGIKDINEAKEYLDNAILGQRLIQITNELLKLKISDPLEIFDNIDAIKLKSSMTLFDYVSSDNDIFYKILVKFYNGQKDMKTLDIISYTKNADKVITKKIQ